MARNAISIGSALFVRGILVDPVWIHSVIIPWLFGLPFISHSHELFMNHFDS